jgi:hypothetical protein
MSRREDDQFWLALSRSLLKKGKHVVMMMMLFCATIIISEHHTKLRLTKREERQFYGTPIDRDGGHDREYTTL